MNEPLDIYDLRDWEIDSKECWLLAISELAKGVTQPSVYRNRAGIEPSKIHGAKNPSTESDDDHYKRILDASFKGSRRA